MQKNDRNVSFVKMIEKKFTFYGYKYTGTLIILNLYLYV